MFYRFHWELNIIIITYLVIFLLSSIIFRKPYLNHVSLILFSTAVGIIYGFFPFTANLYKETFSAEVLINIFFPIVIIKLLYTMDMYMIERSIIQILSLSAIGHTVVVLFIGVVADFTTSRTDISINNCIVIGMLYYVCDIPEIIFKLESVKNLELIIVSEAFLSMVVTSISLEIFIGIYAGYVNAYYHTINLLIRYVVLAILFGMLCGRVFAIMLRKSYSDTTDALLVILSSSYFGYSIAEQFIYCSGVITSGIIVYELSKERSGLSPQVDAEVKTFLNEMFEIVHKTIVIITCLISVILMFTFYDDVEILIGCFGYFIQITFRSVPLAFLTMIINRMGYGFNFTSLVILIWRPIKGPLPLLLALKLYQEGVLKIISYDTYTYIFVFYVIQLMMNKWIQTLTLNKFSIGKISQIHHNNVSNAIKILQARREKILANLKADRFFNGANWTLINNITKVHNPFESEDDNLFENIFLYTTRMTTCPKCFQRLHVQPTRAEIRDMSRVVRTRILKIQRISFVQQYERGCLNKEQLNELFYAIDSALDSDDLFVRLDDLFSDIREPALFHHIRLFLKRYQEVDDCEVPLSLFKRICHRISKHVLFELIAFVVTAVLIIDKIEAIAHGEIFPLHIIVEASMNTLLIINFIIVLNSYSSQSLQEGMKKYFNYSWNGIDFVSMIINTVNVYVITIRYIYNETAIDLGIIILMGCACIRILRIFKYIVAIYPKLTGRFDKKLDKKAYNTYSIGKAILVSFEDIMHQLQQLVDDTRIKEALKNRVNSDKIVIMERLSLLQKIRPWLCGAVETKQSVKCTLKVMKSYVYDLKNTGTIDSYDLSKIITYIDERFKNIFIYRNIQTIAPAKIFSEIPWTYGDSGVNDFMSRHITNRIFTAGEVVCYNGDVFDTIIIVVEGIFKTYYKPSLITIKNLKENGRLPVKELIYNSNFLDEQTDCIMIGNIIGEMGALTERECSNTIVCYLPARALILTKSVIDESMRLDPNPATGLWSRLWKKVSFNLTLRLLLDSTNYESASAEKALFLLHDAFVPNLKNFVNLVLCDFVLDVVLLDGIIEDHLTKEVYKAPCYMSRSIRIYRFLKEYPEPILCIIPVSSIEPLDLLMRLENDSELADELDDKLLASQYWDKAVKRSKTMKRRSKRLVSVTLVEPEDIPHEIQSPKMCRCQRKK